MFKGNRKIIFITIILTMLTLVSIFTYKLYSDSEVVYESTPTEGENPGNGKIRITKKDIEKNNEKSKLADEYAKKRRQEIENINTESTLKSVNDNDKVNAYILAFDGVWEMDSALNSDIKYVSINTKSFKDFNEEDKRQLFNYVVDKYHVTVLDMNIDELRDNGYVKDLNFKEGIVFQIDKYNNNLSDLISFEGMKWRSGTGAIGFSFESQKKDGKWEIKNCSSTWIS